MKGIERGGTKRKFKSEHAAKKFHKMRTEIHGAFPGPVKPYPVADTEQKRK